MLVCRLFPALLLYPSDSTRQLPIRAGMTGLRHKPRHKILRGSRGLPTARRGPPELSGNPAPSPPETPLVPVRAPRQFFIFSCHLVNGWQDFLPLGRYSTVSVTCALVIRADRRRPHPRHWQGLAELAGVSALPSRAERPYTWSRFGTSAIGGLPKETRKRISYARISSLQHSVKTHEVGGRIYCSVFDTGFLVMWAYQCNFSATA